MNSDFAAYIDNLKKQIKSFDANLTITEKKLQYGIQLTVTNSDSKVVLSVYNGNKFSAKESYEHFITNYSSYGVLSLTEEEILSITPLTSKDDNIPFDGHSHIDFSQVSSKNQKTKKAGKLRDLAIKRSWTYKPEK